MTSIKYRKKEYLFDFLIRLQVRQEFLTFHTFACLGFKARAHLPVLQIAVYFDRLHHDKRHFPGTTTDDVPNLVVSKCVERVRS